MVNSVDGKFNILNESKTTVWEVHDYNSPNYNGKIYYLTLLKMLFSCLNADVLWTFYQTAAGE